MPGSPRLVRLARVSYHGQIMAEECPFCDPETGRVRLGTEAGLALDDLFPVAEGHTLVVPRRHVRTIYDLPEADQAGLWELVRTVRDDLVEDLRPDGFTIGLNEGSAAGQSVDHAHIHVIPRFLGDVPDPTGGIRAIFPDRARYWERTSPADGRT